MHVYINFIKPFCQRSESGHVFNELFIVFFFGYIWIPKSWGSPEDSRIFSVLLSCRKSRDINLRFDCDLQSFVIYIFNSLSVMHIRHGKFLQHHFDCLLYDGVVLTLAECLDGATAAVEPQIDVNLILNSVRMCFTRIESHTNSRNEIETSILSGWQYSV